MRLGGTVPVTLGETSIPTTTKRPEVGVVGEGEAKPVSDVGYGVKTFKPVKMATIVVVSEEFARANVGGTYDQITDDLGYAIGRGADLLTLHGRSPKTGKLVEGKEYVNQTSNRVVLGSTPQEEGGIAGDLVAGYELVVNDDTSDEFTGFAADSRLRPTLIGATDKNGRPLLQTATNLADRMDIVLGLPTGYSRAVSGRIGASPDQGVRAFGGDWSLVRYGFAQEITIKISTEATVMIDGELVSLWQHNLVGLLVEATYGWTIGNVDAFAAYEIAGS
jgi:HK97 family phage major capsid protein